MPSILVTGANRGLGLEFARQYVADRWRVFACCRNPEGAAELGHLAKSHRELSIHRLDLTDFAQIDALAKELRGKPIDILLNNAGLMGGRSEGHFGRLGYELWKTTLLVNTVAPVKMAEAFVEHVAASERKLVVAMSTMMASLHRNTWGGSYLYRSSKAGMNMAMRSLAADLRKRGIAVLIMNPGWVRTDMGGPQAPLSAEESVGQMRGVIEAFELKDSGRFLNHDGKELPW